MEFLRKSSSRQPLEMLFVSVVTVAEIRFSIELVKGAGSRLNCRIGSLAR